jgi:hypothetical protein
MQEDSEAAGHRSLVEIEKEKLPLFLEGVFTLWRLWVSKRTPPGKASGRVYDRFTTGFTTKA